MPGRRSQMAIPDRLTVIVGVNVDKAGGDDASFGIDLFRAIALEAPDGGDAVAAHGDVALAGSGSGSVHDRPIADDEVEPCAHRTLPFVASLTPLEHPKPRRGCQWQYVHGAA